MRPPLIHFPRAAAGSRRQFLSRLGSLSVLLGSASRGGERAGAKTLTVHTFGDSILDCAHYNAYGVDPGRLLVRNDDRLFPDFRGQDLASRGPARLAHHAADGATLASLPAQARFIEVAGPGIALLTIGGNDLLGGLAADRGDGIAAFADRLDRFLSELPLRPVLIGNVYDPTFGEDRRNFLSVAPALARANLGRINAALAGLAGRYGALADLHAHFLKGDPSWFTRTVEPSLSGASEVRRVFLAAALRVLPNSWQP